MRTCTTPNSDVVKQVFTLVLCYFVLFETWMRRQEGPEMPKTLTVGETLAERERS